MLWLCVHFHRLPLEVFTAAEPDAAETALAIVEKHRLCAVNAAASALGAKAGMSAGSALALSDALTLRERAPALERTALESLADDACRFSSQVSVRPPDRLLLEIGASLRLFGGAAALLHGIGADVTARGHHARHGIGPTPLSAELLSQALPCTADTLPPWATGGEPAAFRHALHALSVRFLDAPGKQQLAMDRMGISLIGEVLALPAAAVGKRFGKDFIDYLARLVGERPDPRPLHRPREEFRLGVHFLEPLGNSAMLLFPMQRLLGGMSRFLDRRQRYCQLLEWRLGMARGGMQALPIACSLQQNRCDALLALTRLALEQLRVEGSIESLELRCVESAPLQGQAEELFGPVENTDPQAEHLLLDRLRLRLGHERVYGLHLRDTHLPEQAWSTVQEAPASGRYTTPTPRPCWLLSEPLALEEREGRPVWKGRIDLLSGPERIDTAWWSTPQCRDYFIAQHEDGALLWVFRERNTLRWFAQGLFG